MGAVGVMGFMAGEKSSLARRGEVGKPAIGSTLSQIQRTGTCRKTLIAERSTAIVSAPVLTGFVQYVSNPIGKIGNQSGHSRRDQLSHLILVVARPHVDTTSDGAGLDDVARI